MQRQMQNETVFDPYKGWQALGAILFLMLFAALDVLLPYRSSSAVVVAGTLTVLSVVAAIWRILTSSPWARWLQMNAFNLTLLVLTIRTWHADTQALWLWLGVPLLAYLGVTTYSLVAYEQVWASRHRQAGHSQWQPGFSCLVLVGGLGASCLCLYVRITS